MTDHDMDSRLREAGRRWRAATDATGRGPEVEWLGRPVQTPRRLLGSLVAAAVVAALAVGGVALARHDGRHPDAASGVSTTPSTHLFPIQLHSHDAGLEAGVWTLAEVRGGDGVYRDGAPVLGAGGTSLAQSGERIRVSERCSQVYYTFDRAADEARVTADEGGPHSCPADLPTVPGSVEATEIVDRVFDGAVTWQVSSGKLVVTKPNVGTLTFLPPGSGFADRPLTGRTWRLESVVDAGGAAHPANDESLMFAVGRVTASDGCNTLSASARATANTLVLDRVGTTHAACLATTASRQVVGAVIEEGTSNYAVVDNLLVIWRGAQALWYRG